MATKKNENVKEPKNEIQRLKTQNKALKRKIENLRQNEIMLDRMLQRGVILQRGDYISTKIGKDIPKNPYSDYKVVIGEVVAKKYINDFDSVLLDAGSTAERIAQKLFEHRKYLTIMTNNMGAWANFCGTTAKTLKDLLQELKAQEPGENTDDTSQKISAIQTRNELVLSGGRYAQMYDSLLGDQTQQAFDTFSPSVVIIGISGLIADEGLFCHGGEESGVKERLWQTKTTKRIIATTSDKFGKRDSHRFGDIEKALAHIDSGGETILITDVKRKEEPAYSEEHIKLKQYNLSIIEVEYDEKNSVANLYNSDESGSGKPWEEIKLGS